MAMVRTGTFLKSEVCNRLQGLHRAALETTESELAMDRFYVELNKEAVAAGLPEPLKDEDGDTINYGVDYATGEVLGWVKDR